LSVMHSGVKVYRVTGVMRLARTGERRKFTIETMAVKPEHAVEKVFNELGSRHKLKRNHIKILEVKELSPEEASNPFVKALLQLDRLVIP